MYFTVKILTRMHGEHRQGCVCGARSSPNIGSLAWLIGGGGGGGGGGRIGCLVTPMNLKCQQNQVGTGSQNHMTYGVWNANYSMIFASWQFSAGVCRAVSRDLGTSGQVRWGSIRR